MLIAILGAVLLLALTGVATVFLLRRRRRVDWVSPILLEEALDPDLRRLCRVLRRRRGLSVRRRRQLGRIIVHVAARRASGTTSPEDVRVVRQLRRVLHRRAESRLDPQLLRG